MIKELYEKAGELHGHYCPGLAIGVRAAAAALDIRARRKRKQICTASPRAAPATSTEYRSFSERRSGTGVLKCATVTRRRSTSMTARAGKSVRLAAAVMPEGLSRDEKRDFILTAPLDEVFTQTPVRFEAPPDLPPKKKR